MSYRYAPKDEIAGRVVIAQLEAGPRPAMNVYLIHYACCDKEVAIQEQSLVKADKEDNGLPAFCPSCRKNRSIAQAQEEGWKAPSKKPSPSSSSFATWPAPPGSVHRP